MWCSPCVATSSSADVSASPVAVACRGLHFAMHCVLLTPRAHFRSEPVTYIKRQRSPGANLSGEAEAKIIAEASNSQLDLSIDTSTLTHGQQVARKWAKKMLAGYVRGGDWARDDDEEGGGSEQRREEQIPEELRTLYTLKYLAGLHHSASPPGPEQDVSSPWWTVDSEASSSDIADSVEV